MFISASEIHMAHQLRKNREDVMEMARAAVARAKGYCPDVEFSPMDASRSDPEFVYQLLEATIEEGATTVNVPDTVGYAIPQEFGELIASLQEHVPNIDRARISVHCHNDLGMATANSLAGVLNGARQVEGAINGIGERAGNTSIEEVIMAIRTHGDFTGLHTDVRTEELYHASRLVERVSGMAVQSNKAVVGKNAFRHSSGIHQDGVLKLRETYEIMDPASIGIPTGDSIVLTKVSGRHGLRARIADLGVSLDDATLDRVYEAFKDVADRKDEVDDRDLQAILAEQASVQVQELWTIDLVQVSAGDHASPTATVRLIDPDGEVRQDAAIGRGAGRRDLPGDQPRDGRGERAHGVQREVGDRGHRRGRRGHDSRGGGRARVHGPRGRHGHPRGVGAGVHARAEPAAQCNDGRCHDGRCHDAAVGQCRSGQCRSGQCRSGRGRRVRATIPGPGHRRRGRVGDDRWQHRRLSRRRSGSSTPCPASCRTRRGARRCARRGSRRTRTRWRCVRTCSTSTCTSCTR